MSIPVAVDEIADQMGSFGSRCYLLTVRDDQTPHIAHVAVELVANELRCGASRTAARNVAERSTMSLLWPPFEDNGYSMIVDGEARCDGDEIVVVPTSGVLHRPAPSDAEPSAGCSSDGGHDCAALG